MFLYIVNAKLWHRPKTMAPPVGGTRVECVNRHPVGQSVVLRRRESFVFF